MYIFISLLHTRKRITMDASTMRKREISFYSLSLLRSPLIAGIGIQQYILYRYMVPTTDIYIYTRLLTPPKYMALKSMYRLLRMRISRGTAVCVCMSYNVIYA